MGLGIVYREICLKCGGNSRTDSERLKNESRMTFEEGGGKMFADLVRMVNQSTANRTLFYLRTVDEIRASFAKPDEGADRNAWLSPTVLSRLS